MINFNILSIIKGSVSLFIIKPLILNKNYLVAICEKKGNYKWYDKYSKRSKVIKRIFLDLLVSFLAIAVIECLGLNKEIYTDQPLTK